MMAQEDSRIIFLYLGMLGFLVPMCFYVIFMHKPANYNPNVDPDIGDWTNIEYIFRLFFFVTLIVLGTASVVQILKTYKINYMYIFEIDPKNHMTYYQLYRVTLLMSVVMWFCLLCQVIVFQFYWDFPNNSKGPTFLLTAAFLICIMFNPLRVLYSVARFDIIKVLGHILVAPFGLVKFKHFFLADIITSAKLMLSDSTAMVCFYSTFDYHSEVPVTCSWQPNLNYVWNMIPYWWRFWQCIHRYHGDRTLITQLYNAGKYFVGFMAGVLAMMYKLTGG